MNIFILPNDFFMDFFMDISQMAHIALEFSIFSSLNSIEQDHMVQIGQGNLSRGQGKIRDLFCNICVRTLLSIFSRGKCSSTPNHANTLVGGCPYIVHVLVLYPWLSM